MTVGSVIEPRRPAHMAGASTSVPACAPAWLAAESMTEAATLIAAQAQRGFEGVQATLLWRLDSDSDWSHASPGALSGAQKDLAVAAATAPAAPAIGSERAASRTFAQCAVAGSACAVLLWSFDAIADHECAARRAACEAFFAAAMPYVVDALEKAALRAALERLEKSERLQRALFAIADMASSELDMPEMLRSLHEIVAGLMYAENLYIALHDPVADTIRFIYFADVADTDKPPLEEVFPMARFERGLTWYLVRDKHALMGTQEQMVRQVSGPLRYLGSDSLDWLGVPMIRGSTVYGVLVVQSYVERPRYTQDDQALLSFVGSHVLTALERKRAQEELERRVEQRTHELAEANQVLTAEVQERQRGERLQRSLFRIAELSNTAGSMEEFYAAVHAAVGELINASNFYIALLSADGRELQFPYFVDELNGNAEPRPLGNGATEHVIRTRRALLADLHDIDRLQSAGHVTMLGPTPQSWLGVPLVCADSVLGAVAVQSYSPQIRYSERDQELLVFVAHQFANSLERRRAGDALKRANAELELRVAGRTRELREQIAERRSIEAALQQRNSELEGLNRKLAGAQSQLLQSEKMASVGQLAAGVAHEINNPIGYVHSNLTSLTGYLQDIFLVFDAYERFECSLAGTPVDLAPIQSIKRRIEIDYLRKDIANLMAESIEGITRVEKIVRDLKDFSHVDQAEWQVVDLHTGLDSTLNVVWHELKYKAELVKDYGELPAVECLPFQINQVFMNLLVNAAQAIEQHGTITIRSGCEDGQVRVAISDSGKGIDPRQLNRIFEPFFTTKPVGIGTGLGLSVSYGIIQKHGGSIDVESEPGRGSTFTVRLPVTQSARGCATEGDDTTT